MNISKFSSNYNVLDSGSVMTFDSEAQVGFNVECDETFAFKVVIRFERENSELSEIRRSAEGNTIIYTCINFRSNVGVGTSEALELATYNGKKIFFHFWIYDLGQAVLRKVEYTLYQEM